VERRNDRDVEGSDEVENVSAIRPAPDSVLVLDRNEVDVAVVDGASRQDLVLRGVASDPVMDLAGIRVELICVMQRNDLKWPSGGSEVAGEGGDSTATRGVGGSERNPGHPYVRHDRLLSRGQIARRVASPRRWISHVATAMGRANELRRARSPGRPQVGRSNIRMWCSRPATT
jgi:hypothetical protein